MGISAGASLAGFFRALPCPTGDVKEVWTREGDKFVYSHPMTSEEVKMVSDLFRKRVRELPDGVFLQKSACVTGDHLYQKTQEVIELKGKIYRSVCIEENPQISPQEALRQKMRLMQLAQSSSAWKGRCIVQKNSSDKSVEADCKDASNEFISFVLKSLGSEKTDTYTEAVFPSQEKELASEEITKCSFSDKESDENGEISMSVTNFPVLREEKRQEIPPLRKTTVT